MGSPRRRKQPFLTHQTLPALLYIALGIVMMAMPFIVAHSGYMNDVMIADESAGGSFEKTLVLIGQESLEGSVGIILNKPLSEKQRADLSAFIRDSGIPVGYGGPLEVSQKIFVIEEKRGDGGAVSFDISTWDDAVRDTPNLLDKIRASIKKGEHRYRVFTGFAGWGAFQLEDETLVRNKWHSAPATHDLVFQNGPDAQWDTLNSQIKAKETPPANKI